MWKQIRTFNYEIDEDGTIRNKKTGKFRKGYLRKDGYIGVQLYLGKVVNFQLHRLLAEAFIPNPKNKPFINHKDSNKQNNALDNLEWVTHQENVLHSYKWGYASNVGSKNMYSKLTEDSVKEVRRRHAAGESHKQIADSMGLSFNCIRQVNKRITWKHVN